MCQFYLVHAYAQLVANTWSAVHLATLSLCVFPLTPCCCPVSLLLSPFLKVPSLPKQQPSCQCHADDDCHTAEVLDRLAALTVSTATTSSAVSVTGAGDVSAVTSGELSQITYGMPPVPSSTHQHHIQVHAHSYCTACTPACPHAHPLTCSLIYILIPACCTLLM